MAWLRGRLSPASRWKAVLRSWREDIQANRAASESVPSGPASFQSRSQSRLLPQRCNMRIASATQIKCRALSPCKRRRPTQACVKRSAASGTLRLYAAEIDKRRTAQHTLDAHHRVRLGEPAVMNLNRLVGRSSPYLGTPARDRGRGCRGMPTDGGERLPRANRVGWSQSSSASSSGRSPRSRKYRAANIAIRPHRELQSGRLQPLDDIEHLALAGRIAGPVIRCKPKSWGDQGSAIPARVKLP